MQDSVFTKIIKGEIPSHKVYEDDLTLAFLDINPVADGMTVVVSKKQVVHFEDLPDADYTALWQTVRIVAKKLRLVFPAYKKIAVQVEGFDVDHAHVKVFPMNSAEDFRALADGLEPDHAALAALAAKLNQTEVK